MQRSPKLVVTVHCPHFDRPVRAERNQATDRLCSCSDSDTCRDPHAVSDDNGHVRPFPRGCPVFPQLAK